jgi:hypothetical protein
MDIILYLLIHKYISGFYEAYLRYVLLFQETGRNTLLCSEAFLLIC